MSTRNQSQTGSNTVWRNAPTNHVDVDGTTFAGKQKGVRFIYPGD